MRKMIILVSVLFAWTTSLPAANITREQANAIVLDYLQNEVMHPNYSLYVNVNTPSEDGFVVTTYKEETVKAKYACWVYFVYENISDATAALPISCRYLFVKEDNGTLLEIITTNDYVPNLSSWEALDISGMTEPKENNQSIYPNPVGDWLILPGNGEPARVEIYDLKGSHLFSGLLTDNRLNVAFLSAGVYMVRVSGVETEHALSPSEMYKIIKK